MCAMISPSQKVDDLARKRNPITPPSSVVASTPATHPRTIRRRNPAPINRLLSASPSGNLWMQRAQNNDHLVATVADVPARFPELNHRLCCELPKRRLELSRFR